MSSKSTQKNCQFPALYDKEIFIKLTLIENTISYHAQKTHWIEKKKKKIKHAWHMLRYSNTKNIYILSHVSNEIKHHARQ